MADVPPPYSPSGYPEQLPASFSLAQPFTYQLRQINRKHQMLVPLGATAVPTYRIQKNSLSGLFNKRPDMTISRVSSPALVERVVANLRINKSVSYPWVPRATISYEDGESLNQNMTLEISKSGSGRSTLAVFRTTGACYLTPHLWFSPKDILAQFKLPLYTANMALKHKGARK